MILPVGIYRRSFIAIQFRNALCSFQRICSERSRQEILKKIKSTDSHINFNTEIFVDEIISKLNVKKKINCLQLIYEKLTAIRPKPDYYPV